MVDDNRDVEIGQYLRAESVDPALMSAAIAEAGVTHVVTVPDTHQKSLIAHLQSSPQVEVVQACTEDEVLGINVGLYVTGHTPLILIQNAGFYACLNSVRGLSLDGRIPTCMLIGEYLRDPCAPSRRNEARVVHLLEPTLECWDIPYYRVDGVDDVTHIGHAMRRASEGRTAVAVLIGAVTAEP